MYLTYVDYDYKLGKGVRLYHGITAVLCRDVPGPYRHCENGASIRNLKPLAILCGCTVRFVSDLVGNPEGRFSYEAARSTLTLIGDAKTEYCALYLGFQGYSFFLCLLLNIDCGYSLKPLQGGGSNMYQQSLFK